MSAADDSRGKRVIISPLATHTHPTDDNDYKYNETSQQTLSIDHRAFVTHLDGIQSGDVGLIM